MKRLAAILTLALAVTLAPSVGATAKAGDPDYHRPTVGECHNYTFDEMMARSDTTPVVDCAESHTGQAVSVVTLPDSVSWKDYDRALRVVSRLCLQDYYTWLGRPEVKRVLTAYGRAVFIPTLAERSEGARWARCDALLWRGKSKLSPLPYTETPLIRVPIEDSIARCLTSNNYYTVCDGRHVWRASGAFKINKAKYPPRKTMIKIGRKRCPDYVTTGTYIFYWPTKDAWKTGSRAMVCYSKTTR